MAISRFLSGARMTKRASAVRIAGVISGRRLPFWGALLTSTLVLPALAQAPKSDARPPSGAGATQQAAPMPVLPASPQPVADCRTLLERLNKMMALYKQAAAEDLGGQALDKAMDKARNEALKGNKDATIKLVGYTSLVQAREGSYPIQVVRQVCTFAERNGLPLHVTTCAYFHMLNPMGEADAKASAARKAIARFEAGKEQPSDLAEHIGVLKACLPAKP